MHVRWASLRRSYASRQIRRKPADSGDEAVRGSIRLWQCRQALLIIIDRDSNSLVGFVTDWLQDLLRVCATSVSRRDCLLYSKVLDIAIHAGDALLKIGMKLSGIYYAFSTIHLRWSTLACQPEGRHLLMSSDQLAVLRYECRPRTLTVRMQMNGPRPLGHWPNLQLCRPRQTRPKLRRLSAVAACRAYRGVFARGRIDGLHEMTKSIRCTHPACSASSVRFPVGSSVAQ